MPGNAWQRGGAAAGDTWSELSTEKVERMASNFHSTTLQVRHARPREMAAWSEAAAKHNASLGTGEAAAGGGEGGARQRVSGVSGAVPVAGGELAGSEALAAGGLAEEGAGDGGGGAEVQLEVDQAAHVEWLYFRTDNGTEFYADLAASQYGLFDYIHALPRPRGIRPYRQWGAEHLAEQLEYASLHVHARLPGLSPEEAAEREREDDEYMRDLDKRLIFLRDAASGEEIPLTPGDYRPPSRRALYGNLTQRLSAADVGALVSSAQQREAQGETQAVLEGVLVQQLAGERSRLLCGAGSRSEGESLTLGGAEAQAASQEGESAPGRGAPEPDLAHVCTNILYYAARDLLARCLDTLVPPGDLALPGDAGVAAAGAAAPLHAQAHDQPLGASGSPASGEGDGAARSSSEASAAVDARAKVCKGDGGGGVSVGGLAGGEELAVQDGRRVGFGGAEEEGSEEEEVELDESVPDEVVLVQWAASIGDVPSLRILLENNGLRLALSGPPPNEPRLASPHDAADAEEATGAAGAEAAAAVAAAGESESKVQGLSPVHMAALYGHAGTVRYLVNKCGLSANPRENNMGLSPLHFAANNGHVRCARKEASSAAASKATHTHTYTAAASSVRSSASA